MLHDYVHAACPYPCSMSRSMLHVQVHSAWSWILTSSKDEDMQHGHEHRYGQDEKIDYYWTGTLGHNEAKVRNYVNIDIVIRCYRRIMTVRNFDRRNPGDSANFLPRCRSVSVILRCLRQWWIRLALSTISLKHDQKKIITYRGLHPRWNLFSVVCDIT